MSNVAIDIVTPDSYGAMIRIWKTNDKELTREQTIDALNHVITRLEEGDMGEEIRQ